MSCGRSTSAGARSGTADSLFLLNLPNPLQQPQNASENLSILLLSTGLQPPQQSSIPWSSWRHGHQQLPAGTVSHLARNTPCARQLLGSKGTLHQPLEPLVSCHRRSLQLQPVERPLQLLCAALAHRQLVLLPVPEFLLRAPARPRSAHVMHSHLTDNLPNRHQNGQCLEGHAWHALHAQQSSEIKEDR